MRFPKALVSVLVYVLAVALPEVTFSINAHAGMIPTSAAVADVSRAENLRKVDSFLQRAEVQRELVKRGVQPAEARARIASLSDFELQKIAGNVDSAPAGADVIVISLTTILLIVIIILLVTR